MIRKDGHTDVASARRLCNNIMEDCQDIIKALPNDDAAPLPTWWTNKLAVSAAYINSDRDYLVYTMEDTPEATEEPMPQSPSQMLVTMGEEDAAEKREESEDNIEKHKGADEEAFTFTFERDNDISEKTGDIKEGSSEETSSSNSSEVSGKTSS